MNPEEIKAAAERDVFFAFVNLSNLPIDLESVESRKPPEPDIFCRYSDGTRLTFELVSLCDPDLAELFNKRDQEPEVAMFFGGERTLKQYGRNFRMRMIRNHRSNCFVT